MPPNSLPLPTFKHIIRIIASTDPNSDGLLIIIGEQVNAISSEYSPLLRRLPLKIDTVLNLGLELAEVVLIVHFLDNLAPLPLLYLVLYGPIVQLLQVFLVFRWVTLPKDRLQKCEDCLLDRLLDEAKLLIAFVSENLTKKGYLMVILGELFDASDDGSGPLDDKILETIALVKVGVHVLLHRLLSLLTLFTLQVKFHLIRIHVMNQFFELFEG